MNKWIVITGVAAFVCVVVILIWLLPSSEPLVTPLSPDATIVFFGDSLVQGVGAPAGQGMVSVLERKLQRPIINAGRGGDTTHDGLARLQQDVLVHDPALVIILLGGNDVLRQLPWEETFRNLGAIVDQVHESGAQVLLVGVRGGALYDDYYDDFEALAKEKDVRIVPDILDDVFGHASLMSDATHPNVAGYAIMADRMERALQDFVLVEQN